LIGAERERERERDQSECGCDVCGRAEPVCRVSTRATKRRELKSDETELRAPAKLELETSI